MTGGFEADPGAKAAALAVCAGCVLVIDLLPKIDGLYGDLAGIITRAASAILALGAGWNWLSKETDGAQLVYLWPVVLFILLIVTIFAYSIVGAFLIYLWKQTKRGGLN